MHQLRLFFTALQFFSRIPVPEWVGFDPAWMSPSLRFFPAVGWLVAFITTVVYLLACHFWSPSVAVILSTAAGIWTTGAFHEDGFADVCDGFGGGMTQARVLEIMRDSRVGAYGAIGIGMLLLLKCMVLASLPLGFAALALLVAHPLSRLACCVVIYAAEYVNENGKAKMIAHELSSKDLVTATLSVALPVVGLLLWGGLKWQALLAGIVFGCLALVWLVRLFRRRIGGYTGDCLGTVQQLTEVAFYLGFSGLIQICAYT